MLPGFRVLLATILLSMSLLVFGLGAAALLRAAHREFANLPSQRPPESIFAQQDDAAPTLAMLQVEAPGPSEDGLAAPADEVQAEADQQPTTVLATEPASAAEAETVAMRSDAPESPPLSEPAEDLPSATATQDTPVQVAAPSPAIEPSLDDVQVTQTTSADSPIPATPEPDASASARSSADAPVASPVARVSSGPAAKISNKRPSKKRAAVAVTKPAAVAKKPAMVKQVVVRRKVTPRPRIAGPAPPRSAPPFASPFGGWDNRGPASGRTGKTAFGF